MTRLLRQPALGLAFLLGILWSSSLTNNGLAAVAPPSPVALTGTAAPAGGNYSSFTATTMINAAGQVAFVANLSGGSATSGIFSGTPGALQATALQGSAAPTGGNYSAFFAPVISPTGTVGFMANLSDGTSTRGIYHGTPGSLQTIAVTGMTAPAGGNISNLGGFTLSSSGKVGFIADLTGGTSTQGLFSGTPGSLQTIALQGPSPGGTTYGTFQNTFQQNAGGAAAFISTVTDVVSNKNVFAGPTGSVQPVALFGGTSPSGGTYTNFFNPMINDANQVSFLGLTTSVTNPSAILSNVSGSLQALATQGLATPAGGVYGSFFNPVLNNSGQILFGANISGGSATSGIFLSTTTGTVQTVAARNAPSPDGIGNYNGFPTRVTLNDLGQAAFTATLTGTGVTTANDTGLFAGTPGNVVTIVREGDIIDVDPGPLSDLRTVSGIGFVVSDPSDSRGNSFSAAGQLVYTLNFTDGSSGIFTSVVPIPEPGMIGVIAVSAVGLWGWCRRRVRGSSKTMPPHDKAADGIGGHF